MTKKIMALLCPAILLSQAMFGQCKLDYSNYHLVLHEDFAEGITVNDLNDPNHPRGVWQYYHDDPAWGWGDDWSNPNFTGNCNPTPNQWGEYYDQSQVSIYPDPTEQGDGILRLTAERIPECSQHLITTTYTINGQQVHRFPNFKSGMIQLRRDVFANTPANCPHTFDAPVGGSTNWDGYTHGMFEIRMRIPHKGDFPAFWLAGASQINIYEGKDNPMEFMVGYNDWSTSMGAGSHYRRWFSNSLADDFHTYTCVWTPTQITFFFDGRELATYDKDVAQLPNWGHNSIIASHQVWYYALNGGGWEIGEETYMDIDYIKVYKPNNNDYSLSYKSDDQFINHNTFESHGGAVAAASKARSIAFDPTDASQLFFAGTDGRFYDVIDANGDQSWVTLNQIQYSNPNFPAENIDGDLIFDQTTGKYLYRGADGRVQYYLYSGGSWQHGYVDNNWGTTQFLVANDEAVMAVDHNSAIIYKGTDDKIHYFANGWGNAHAWIGHNYVANSTENHYVKNDIILERIGNYTHVIYKGNDDRLQIFWVDQNQTPAQYVHGYIDNSGISNWKVKSEPGSVVLGDPGEIFYIGVDNKIQRYYISGTTWVHETLPYTYNSVGYWNGDYAREGITYDPNARKVYYIGNDGRMQEFYEDANGWQHGYVDDYWNTNLYSSYYDQDPIADRPSLIFNAATDRIHYLSGFNSGQTFGDPSIPLSNPQGPWDHRGYPKYFVWEACEVFNPTFGPTPMNKGNPDGDPTATTVSNTLAGKSKIAKDGLLAYPNPSQNGIFKLNYGIDNVKMVKVIDSKGAVIKQYNTAVKEIDISAYPNGIYILNIISDHSVQHQKLMLNR